MLHFLPWQWISWQLRLALKTPNTWYQNHQPKTVTIFAGETGHGLGLLHWRPDGVEGLDFSIELLEYRQFFQFSEFQERVFDASLVPRGYRILVFKLVIQHIKQSRSIPVFLVKALKIDIMVVIRFGRQWSQPSTGRKRCLAWLRMRPWFRDSCKGNWELCGTDARKCGSRFHRDQTYFLQKPWTCSSPKDWDWPHPQIPFCLQENLPRRLQKVIDDKSCQSAPCRKLTFFDI